MKKIILIAVTAFIAVTGFAQQKFAHVNFVELVQLCPEADQARATMAASSKEANDTYAAMYEEFQTKLQAYQQKGATWTQAIRESKEKELTEIRQRIEEFSQAAQAELAQQEQQLMAPIYEKASNIINEIGKKGGYVYVFDKGTALFVNEAISVDITAEARAAMGVPEGRTLESLQQEMAAQAQAAQ